jgi:hypothetical protein
MPHISEAQLQNAHGLDCISALKGTSQNLLYGRIIQLGAWQLGPFGKQRMHLFIRASSSICTAVGKFLKRRFSG